MSLHSEHTPEKPEQRRAANQRRGAIALLLLALAASIYYGYQRFGPTPLRTYKRFVRAFNAGDFHAQYQLFVRDEMSGLPLIPEEDFRNVLRTMNPPFPAGVALSVDLVEIHPFSKRMGAIKAGVLQRGQGPPATGQWPDQLDIGLQREEQGWGIRGWFTYLDYYRRTYGDEAKDRFWYLYSVVAYRRGLLKANEVHRP